MSYTEIINNNNNSTSINVTVTPLDVTIENNAFTVGSFKPESLTVYQGMLGLPGPPDIDSFKTFNRFNEIASDELAKQQAVANLGLSVIDGGTFN